MRERCLKSFIIAIPAYVLVILFIFILCLVFKAWFRRLYVGVGLFSWSNICGRIGRFLPWCWLSQFMGILNDRLWYQEWPCLTLEPLSLLQSILCKSEILLGLTIGYSLVVLLINGVNQLWMYFFLKVPILMENSNLGNGGYALVLQLAGVLYILLMFSPMAILLLSSGNDHYNCRCPSIKSTLNLPNRVNPKNQERLLYQSDFWPIKPISTIYWLLLFIPGVGNAGHAIFLPCCNIVVECWNGLNSCINFCICESPLIFYSYLFMDKLSAKKLLLCPVTDYVSQYTTIYGLNLGLASKIILTLASKHVPGMLLIMVTLKIVQRFCGYA